MLSSEGSKSRFWSTTSFSSLQITTTTQRNCNTSDACSWRRVLKVWRTLYTQWLWWWKSHADLAVGYKPMIREIHESHQPLFSFFCVCLPSLCFFYREMQHFRYIIRGLSGLVENARGHLPVPADTHEQSFPEPTKLSLQWCPNDCTLMVW